MFYWGHIMNNNYIIKPVREFLDHIDKRKGLVKVDSFTNAALYTGNDGRFYLIPAVGYLGIESPELETLDSILRSGHIPIEEDGVNFLAENRDLVSELPNGSGMRIITGFFQKYGLQIDTTTLTFDPTALNAVVNKTKGEARFKEFAFALGVLIGERLRLTDPAQWILEKRYGYNPYYEPKLQNSEKKIVYNPWFYLTRKLLTNQKFDFVKADKEVYQLPMQ
jgi:hypothetical protein